jgi:hypothetical protein
LVDVTSVKKQTDDENMGHNHPVFCPNDGFSALQVPPVEDLYRLMNRRLDEEENFFQKKFAQMLAVPKNGHTFVPLMLNKMIYLNSEKKIK